MTHGQIWMACVAGVGGTLVAAGLLGLSRQESPDYFDAGSFMPRATLAQLAGRAHSHALPPADASSQTPAGTASTSRSLPSSRSLVRVERAPSRMATPAQPANHAPATQAPAQAAALPDRAPAPSPALTPPVVTRMESLERSGRIDDAIVLAFQEGPTMLTRERRAVLDWLMSRQSSGRVPVLFTIARMHALDNSTEQAARWYMAASICGMMDASRLADPQAHQAVRAMEANFTEVRGALRADPTLRREAVAFALETEERLARRERALWIANELSPPPSSGAGSPSDARFIPDDQWQAKRRQYRATLLGYVQRDRAHSPAEHSTINPHGPSDVATDEPVDFESHEPIQ